MVGFLVLALAVSCAHSLVVPAPALPPKPIPGTETYVAPQILLGQAEGDVLWAVPWNSPLRATPVAPPPQTVYTVEAAKALHKLRTNDPHWNVNFPIQTWEAVGPPTQAPAAPPAAV